MEKKLQIVLGGTSGMGLATAIALGKQGPVLVGGRNQARLEKAVESMKEAGVEGHGKTCDISDKGSLDEFVNPQEDSRPQLSPLSISSYPKET